MITKKAHRQLAYLFALLLFTQCVRYAPHTQIPILTYVVPMETKAIYFSDYNSLHEDSVEYLILGPKHNYEAIKRTLYHNEKIKYISVRNASRYNADSLISVLSNAKSLKYLELEHLDTLPPKISLLSNIEWLSINNSHLNSLPSEIGDLKNLKTLNLGFLKQHMQQRNQLKILPDQIKNLDHLENIYLCGNQFETFPEVLCQLKHLKFIHLGNNPIGSISQCLCNKDIVINLSHTKLNRFELKKTCLKFKNIIL